MSTPTPTPNVPLFRALAQWITEQHEQAPTWTERANINEDPDALVWDQNTWFHKYTPPSLSCGTTCCMAGYIALTDSEVDVEETLRNITTVVTKDGWSHDVVEFASDKLGISLEDANTLFYLDERNLPQILNRLSELAGEDVRPNH